MGGFLARLWRRPPPGAPGPAPPVPLAVPRPAVHMPPWLWGPDGSGEARSAFRPVGAQRGVPSLIPRPGPLRRIVFSQVPAGARRRRPQAFAMSSCTTRNAITSSYSSTRGFPPVQSRRVSTCACRQRSSAFHKPTCPARRPPGPLKAGSQQGPQAPNSAPLLAQRERQQGKHQDGSSGQKGSLRNRSPARDSSRPPLRKVALLPHRRGEPLRLPSPPHLSFRVTAKDLDAEKKAALQSIHAALWGETEAISGCCAPEPRGPSLLPAASTAPVTIASPPPSPSLPVPSAGSACPSTSTSTGLAPQPASDTEVTPMDTTPPICAQVSRVPPGSTNGNQTGPAPAQAPPSAPGQPALGSTTQAPFGASVYTASTLSTHASTRPAFASTPGVGPSGSATVSSGGSLGRNTRKRKRSHRDAAIVTSTKGPSTPSGPATLSSGGALGRNTRKRSRQDAAMRTHTEGPSAKKPMMSCPQRYTQAGPSVFQPRAQHQGQLGGP